MRAILGSALSVVGPKDTYLSNTYSYQNTTRRMVFLKICGDNGCLICARSLFSEIDSVGSRDCCCYCASGAHQKKRGAGPPTCSTKTTCRIAWLTVVRRFPHWWSSVFGPCVVLSGIACTQQRGALITVLTSKTTQGRGGSKDGAWRTWWIDHQSSGEDIKRHGYRPSSVGRIS